MERRLPATSAAGNRCIDPVPGNPRYPLRIRLSISESADRCRGPPLPGPIGATASAPPAFP